MVTCAHCGRELAGSAAFCSNCGRPLSEDGPAGGSIRFVAPLYEYRSKRTIFGLPLVHILLGPAWATGLRPAVGILAIGHVALGLFAVGGIALGGVTFGGIAVGLMGLGGIAFGLFLALGGISVGYMAVGGIAIGAYALGGLAIGAHTLNNDPELRNMILSLFGKQ